MKLSNKGRYGIRALFDIGFHHEGRATQVKDIAQRQGIPPRFLEQIFQDLKRAGLVSSKRGPRGGYRLARAAADIRLGDIVRALEGPISIGGVDASVAARRRPRDEVGPPAPASTDPPAPTRTDGSSRRVTEDVFADLSRRIEACFDGVTIADLCARGELMGIRRRPRERLVYVI